VSARLLTNAGFTRGAANDPGLPQVAARGGRNERFFGMTMRQTRVGAAVTVHEVLGGTFDTDVDLDFFGGGRNESGNRPLFPEPRLRTARATLRWARTSVMVGQETPLISDLDPLSLAAIGVTQFHAAGDLWNWLSQVRVSRELGGRRLRWGAQAAVLEPFSSVDYGGVGGGDAGERSGRPFFQGRLRARWGAEDPDAPGLDVRDAIIGEGPSEVAVGVHRGWVRVAGGETYASRALSLDWRIIVAPRVELRGEAYRGQLLSGLGGGAISQSFGRPGPDGAVAPLRDAAVWAQVNVRPTERWLAGAGCGIDRVRDVDRPERRQNASCAAHVRVTPAQSLLLGVEYRRVSTLYPTGMFHADHVNLAFGIEL
jgi:hypothetical protein